MGDHHRTTITDDAKSEKNWRKLEYMGPPRALAECDLEEIQSDVYGTFHFKGSLQCTLPYDAYPQPSLDEVAAMELVVHNWLVKYGITGADEIEYKKFKQPYTLFGAFSNPQDAVSSKKNILYYKLLAWLWKIDEQIEERTKAEGEYLAYMERAHIMRVTTLKILNGEIRNMSEVPPNPTFDRYEKRCAALFGIHDMLCREIRDFHMNCHYFINSIDWFFRGAITINEQKDDFLKVSLNFSEFVKLGF